MHKRILLFSLILVLGRCTSHRTVAVRPEPVSLVNEFSDTAGDAEKVLEIEQKTALSLRDVLSMALMRNPELKAFSYETRIREAEALQASLLPNPEFEVEVENFAGSGALNGFQESELTFSAGQLIELGGKRQKRTRAAALGADLAVWDFEVAKLNVFVDVVTLFTQALAIQQQMELQRELIDVNKNFLETIQRRVKAGRDSPAETARAKVELSAAEIELKRLEQQLQAAYKNLSAAWGSTQPQFERLEGNLDTVFALPSLEKLVSLISQNPDVARWTVEIQQRDAEMELEKAQRIPDPVVGAGYRRLNESGDNAFVAGLSIPLQIFDRNQGHTQAAEYRKRQAEQQKKAVEIALQARLAEIYHALTAAWNEITALKTSVIPEAQNAYEMINQGYQMGKYGFLDVLDAQRGLFKVRSQYLNALADYHQNAARLERLIGQQLTDVQ